MEQLAPLPVVIPLIMAALSVLAEKLPGEHRLLDLVGLGTVGTVLAIDLKLLGLSFEKTLVYWFGGWVPRSGFPLGIAFAIDPAAAGLASFAALLTLLGLIFSWHYFRSIGSHYHCLMLLFLGSMQGFCLTGDLFNLFVFFELMGVAAYALTGYKIEDTGPLEGALNFAVLNSIGAFLVLLGLGMIYSRTGGLNLAWIGTQCASQGADLTLQAAFMLLCIGFLVKAAVIPFHFWLPDAHAVAPTPASLLFSGIMVELGIYAVARCYWTLLADQEAVSWMGTLFLSLGLATALLGAGMAFAQRHLKRLLAYSTVSHSGMMLAAFALADPAALGGFFLYLFGHGFVKGGLFIATGIALHRLKSVDEDQLRGRGRKLWLTGPLFCLGGLALAGLPPFGTWAGKALIEQRAEALGYPLVTPLFLISSALTGAAVLRAGLGVFYGAGSPNFLSACAPATGDQELPETAKALDRTPFVMALPLCLLFAAALGTGAFEELSRRVLLASARFCNGEGYRLTVLAGQTGAVPPVPLPQLEWQKGLLSGAAALAAALLALFGLPLPAWLQRPYKQFFQGVLRVVRALHSGYMGDYVIWFLLGSAALLLATWVNSGL